MLVVEGVCDGAVVAGVVDGAIEVELGVWRVTFLTLLYAARAIACKSAADGGGLPARAAAALSSLMNCSTLSVLRFAGR